MEAPQQLGRLLNQSGLCLRTRGLYSEAREFLELALDSAFRQFGPDHPTVAVRRNNLAGVLYSLGDFRGALREIDLALDIFRRTLPAEHPYILTSEESRSVILRGARS
jgi:tetratricopeptide (TPR) repeat protein